ncbi:MAG: CHASE domain-containing protein [Rhizobiaceae bacterium]|nr:CHASE domain-containing protein [Rhizobiaceae bacterium]
MRKYLPVVVFLAVAVASLVMAGMTYFAGVQAGRFKFEAAADDALARIDARIDQHMALLRSTLGFMQANGQAVDRQQFDTFVATLELEKRFAGIRGIGYARLVPVGDEASAATELARNQGADAAIWPAETDQDWRTPVVMFSPLDERSRRVMGFDMFSEPDRRAAMQEAMASGEARATVPLSLVQTDSPGIPGFLVYLPFFPSDTNTDGAGALVPAGFLYASFRIGDLFAAALGRSRELPIHYDVFDGAPDQGRPVYSSERPSSPSFGTDYLVSRELNVAGRQWIVLFSPAEGFEPPNSPGIAFALGALGLILAAAAGMLSRSQSQAYDAIRKLQQTTEKSLQDKDLMLREMNHRIKNSIARVMAIARHTANNAKTLDEFSSSFAARLQAMAASQDMLTRSSWQKADLGELLRIELGQVFGNDLPAEILSGPPVMLTEAQTQALGLTFHELATNALKYGAAGQTVDALRVRWNTDAAGDWLRIRWSETGSPASPPAGRPGFGTRLIDMNITQELGGKLDRSFSEDGLAVTIDIPLKPAKSRQ